MPISTAHELNVRNADDIQASQSDARDWSRDNRQAKCPWKPLYLLHAKYTHKQDVYVKYLTYIVFLTVSV